ncbi:unnamed protein product, partial [Ectocarpus sp. 13 AM-2016]
SAWRCWRCCCCFPAWNWCPQPEGVRQKKGGELRSLALLPARVACCPSTTGTHHAPRRIGRLANQPSSLPAALFRLSWQALANNPVVSRRRRSPRSEQSCVRRF